MNRIVTITFFCLLLVSCSTVKNPFAKTQINYIGDSEYLPDSIPDLRDGTIVLDFISYYKCDTIKIKFGKTLKTVYLNTDDVTGYADIIVLGKINQRQSMELTLNNFQAVTIIILPENRTTG